jgi:hypothetical protein
MSDPTLGGALQSVFFFSHIYDVKILVYFAPKIAKLVKITLQKHIFPKFPRFFLSKRVKIRSKNINFPPITLVKFSGWFLLFISYLRNPRGSNHRKMCPFVIIYLQNWRFYCTHLLYFLFSSHTIREFLEIFFLLNENSASFSFFREKLTIFYITIFS